MPNSTLDTFATFGALLKHVRRRARLTQREFGLAVGYSRAHVARLESGQRTPDVTAVRARFVEALALQQEPALAAQLIALAERAHLTDAVDQAVVLQPAVAHQGNLPARLPRFIGREQDLSEVTRLVRENGLVTLIGAGGVGKTRLALEVGAVMVRAVSYPQDPDQPGPQDAASSPAVFADGVWLTELAPLVDPAAVPHAVAEVFRLPEEVSRTYTNALVEHLASALALLIMDNCEHVVGACAELVEALLAGCPSLHILATSREPLQATGEITWRVPSLVTPDVDSFPGAERLLDYDAVQLFVSQASTALPGFQLTPENLAAAAHICRRLDGIPLAIEMAAAQVDAMTPQEIAARLDERFTLLVNPRRTALPRQRTLRATLDWSDQLLSEPERLLLARLSVFADGCTADLAQVVAADAGMDPSLHVLPLLLQLVRKSLVVADTRGERTRYRLLDTVRHYAAEKLAERGETDATYRRLATHLTRPIPMEVSSPTREWKNRFVAELGNIRSLIAWARHQPDGAVTILQLATTFTHFSFEVGNLAEPLAWLEEGLANRSAVPVALRVTALHRKLAMLDFAGYSLGHWLAQAEELLTLSEQVDNDADKCEALYYLAEAAADGGDLDRAERTLEQALAFSRQRSYLNGIAVPLCRLGLIKVIRGNNAGAAELCLQVLQLGRETGQELYTLLGLSGMVHADASRAVPLIERELTRLRGSAGDWVDGVRAACLMQVSVQALLRIGEYARAEARARESLDLFGSLNTPWFEGWGIADALLELGRIAWLQGDPAAAQMNSEYSLELYRRVGDLEHTAQAHALMGYAALMQGRSTVAANNFRRALAIYRQLDHTAGTVMTQAVLAESCGEMGLAARLYGAAAAAQLPMSNWLTRMDSTFRPAFRVFHDRVIDDAYKRYAHSAFAAAWAEGAEMTLEQASDYADRQSPVI